MQFFTHSKFRFMKYRILGLVISGLLTIVSIASIATQGFNFGIDFRGGILMEVETPVALDLTDLRGKVAALNLGDYSLQTFGAPEEILINIQAQEDEALTQAAIASVRSIFPEGTNYKRVEVVGPKVGEELFTSAAYAVGFALLGILLYIWFRFEWQYSIGAIVATLHDVIMTLGLFSLFQLDFNLTTVAAILTIAGYSVNDTVVIYDRVREELRKYKKMPVPEVIDMALNATLSRTVLTGGTTLLTLGALIVFGGEVIAGFSIALIWGIVVGTYSSLFVASPLLTFFDMRAVDRKPEDVRP